MNEGAPNQSRSTDHSTSTVDPQVTKLEHTSTVTTNNLIPVPPPNPKGGVSILAHKLWIGNLDKRLTE